MFNIAITVEFVNFVNLLNSSHFCQSQQNFYLYMHFSLSNLPSSNFITLLNLSPLYIPKKLFVCLFVICQFSSVFKLYSQFCFLLQDGLIHAVSVFSSTHVRSQTNKQRVHIGLIVSRKISLQQHKRMKCEASFNSRMLTTS